VVAGTPTRIPARRPSGVNAAQYAKRLNSIVAAASRARKVLSGELGKVDVMSDAQLARIARVAWRCAEVFDEARWVARSMSCPPGAEVCQIALRHWLDAQLAACDAISRGAGTKERDHVRTAVRLLREGNAYAHQFNNARRLFVERMAA